MRSVGTPARLLLAAIALACITCKRGDNSSSSNSSNKSEATTPNLLFIVVDTLRADHVSVYGESMFGDRVNTPNIDALARAGVRFERAYAHASMTGPSHASMFTSLFPSDHGVRKNGQVLAAKHHTLAEILDESRRTAAFLSLGALRRKFAFDQGFEEYFDEFDVGWWKNAGQMNDAALPWLRKHGREPFFLWMHYSDPHEPYAPPTGELPEVRVEVAGETVATFPADSREVKLALDLPSGRHEIELVRASEPRMGLVFNHFGVSGTAKRLDGKHLPTIGPARTRTKVTIEVDADDSFWSWGDGPNEALVQFRPHWHPTSPRDKRRGYVEEVEYADAKIGELLATLDELGVRDRTLIVLTSDHGEELGQYTGYFGHVHNLYESLIRVPLVISFPGVLPADRAVADPVRHVDLMPTILELLGFDVPSKIRGKSLVRLADIGARDIIAETHWEDKKAILHDRYKYIHSKAKDTEELYDLDKDPGEESNIIDAHRIAAAAAKRALEQILASSPGQVRPQNADLTEEEREALRALGYTD